MCVYTTLYACYLVSYISVIHQCVCLLSPTHICVYTTLNAKVFHVIHKRHSSVCPSPCANIYIYIYIHHTINKYIYIYIYIYYTYIHHTICMLPCVVYQRHSSVCFSPLASLN